MKPASVVLIDAPTQPTILDQVLLAQGLAVVCRLTSAQGLLKYVEIHQPDIIVMNLEFPDQETLDNLAVLNQYNPKPIILFANEGSSEIISQAVQAGVDAYVVDGLTAHRVKPILDAALARFKEYQVLNKELKQARNQLADRKTIDRAKGLLMKSKGLDEDQAYHAMRKMAMDQSKPLVEIAHNMLSVMALLTP